MGLNVEIGKKDTGNCHIEKLSLQVLTIELLTVILWSNE